MANPDRCYHFHTSPFSKPVKYVGKCKKFKFNIYCEDHVCTGCRGYYPSKLPPNGHRFIKDEIERIVAEHGPITAKDISVIMATEGMFWTWNSRKIGSVIRWIDTIQVVGGGGNHREPYLYDHV